MYGKPAKGKEHGRSSPVTTPVTLRRAEQTAELFVDEGDPTGAQVGCGRRPSPIAGPEWLSRSDGTVLPPLAGAVA